MDIRRVFGNSAEDLAAKFLKAKGYRILTKQFTTRYGEIDLIARLGDEVVFVEVKARRGSAFGYPEESVTQKKLEKITLVAQEYLKKKGWESRDHRIDVIAIEYGEGDPEILHLEGVA
jgi:putative endonuclease